ncbi:hypothetical protein OAB72_01020 [Flavobacteriales bacterium]|jgi:hypothetical protein|nr:hypothetical protein [Flavobacteriales bacterium]
MKLLDLKYKTLIFLLLIGITSCIVPENIKQQEESINLSTKTISSDTVKTYLGWWVYGEGQHIFKDELTLAEYDLTFPNENMEELVELYVSVCEMEYFPMECEMKGILIGSILSVQEFEILYIQGCGE